MGEVKDAPEDFTDVSASDLKLVTPAGTRHKGRKVSSTTPASPTQSSS